MVKRTHSASFNGSSNYLQYSNGFFLNQAIFFFLLNVGKTELAFRYSNYFEEGGTVNGVAVRNGSTLEAAVREGSAQKTLVLLFSK
jgi:hypothetical protein